MYLGTIFSVLNGENNLGIVKFKLTPISIISKKLFEPFAASFEDPMEPIPDISNVSAPRKTFLIERLGFIAKPIL